MYVYNKLKYTTSVIVQSVPIRRAKTRTTLLLVFVVRFTEARLTFTTGQATPHQVISFLDITVAF